MFLQLYVADYKTEFMSIFVQFLLVDRLAVYTMLRLIQRSNTAP